MTSRKIPAESDFNHLVERELLCTNENVAWSEKNENRDHWVAVLPLDGSDIGFDFSLRIQANKLIEMDFGISLVCANRIQVRRLDFGHRHSNPPKFRPPKRVDGPHLHMWTDSHADHYAISIDANDIGDCEQAFDWFLRATNIDFTGQWRSFPATTGRFRGM